MGKTRYNMQSKETKRFITESTSHYKHIIINRQNRKQATKKAHNNNIIIIDKVTEKLTYLH